MGTSHMIIGFIILCYLFSIASTNVGLLYPVIRNSGHIKQYLTGAHVSSKLFKRSISLCESPNTLLCEGNLVFILQLIIKTALVVQLMAIVAVGGFAPAQVVCVAGGTERFVLRVRHVVARRGAPQRTERAVGIRRCAILAPSAAQMVQDVPHMDACVVVTVSFVVLHFLDLTVAIISYPDLAMLDNYPLTY